MDTAQVEKGEGDFSPDIPTPPKTNSTKPPSFEEAVGRFQERMKGFVERTKGLATMKMKQTPSDAAFKAKQKKIRDKKRKNAKAARKRNRR